MFYRRNNNQSVDCGALLTTLRFGSVAQRIEHRFPKPKIRVRFPFGRQLPSPLVSDEEMAL